MGILENLDLLFVGIAISAIGVMGFTIFFSNRRSITNKTFLLFSISAIFWNITNYLTLNLKIPEHILWNLRFHVFTAVWYCFFLFQLFYVFPKEKFTLSKTYKYILLTFVSLVSILTLTPLTFIRIAEISPTGLVSRVDNGPGIFFFGITVALLISAALFILLRKFRKSDEKKYQQQIQLILSGFTITFVLHIAFNFIFPAFFDNPNFITFGAIYTFPLIALTSVAILKHKLFNIKVTGIAFLVFALSVIALGEVIFARELSLIIYRSSVFVLILTIGVLLIKGVLREVSLREQLQEANKRQEELLHFIAHQIKGSLTKSKYIFAELLEGTFGELSDDVRKISKEGLKINNDGVNTVQTILNAANIKTGRMVYDMKPLDVRELVQKVFERQKNNAEVKGLAYNLEIQDDADLPAEASTKTGYNITGDLNQLNEVFLNLIDNSIRYTPSGSINVSLSKISNSSNSSKSSNSFSAIRFSVKDTGVGVTKEDMGHLFEEGKRGKDSIKINVDSTGFGLYIAKNIVEAHHGKISVKSDGQGKGSEFIVELPIII